MVKTIDYDKLKDIIPPPTSADLAEIRTTNWMNQMKLLFANPVAFVRNILIKDYYLIKLMELVTGQKDTIKDELTRQINELKKQLENVRDELNKCKQQFDQNGGKLEELGRQILQLKKAKDQLKSRLHATVHLYRSLVERKF